MKLFSLLFLMLPAFLIAQTAPMILNGHTESVNVVAFSPDGKQLVSGGKDGSIIIWNVEESFKQIHKIQFSDASVTSLAYNNSGNQFAAGTYRKFTTYAAATFKKTKSVKKAHSSFVESIDFSDDDKWVVTSSWKDKALILWNASGLKKSKELAETIWTDDAIFALNDNLVISANHANLVKVWDVKTGNIIRTFAGHDDWVYSIKLTSDNKTLISGSFDHTIKIWDFSSGKLLNTLKGHSDGVSLLALSTDNRYLYSYSVDMQIKIWDLQKGEEATSFSTGTKVLGMSVSADGKYLAVALEDNTIAVYSIDSFLH